MENLFRNINPNKSDISSIKSDKIKAIAINPLLSVRLKALLLVGAPDVGTIFNLTEEELNEFKSNFFNIDSLLGMGKPYVLAYLESTNQKELLKYYLNGENYTKSKLGLIDSLDQSLIYNKIINSTLMKALDAPDVDTKLKCIRTIKIAGTSNSLIDKLADIMKDQDI